LASVSLALLLLVLLGPRFPFFFVLSFLLSRRLVFCLS
jgi:hypothetical protein